MKVLRILALACVSLLAWSAALAQSTPRTVFVHLFEWKWSDVARECETFLGPKGFSAVQVSPPNEHAVVSGFPWWQRYQPVSYLLESRGGTRQEFADMVSRCQAAGVDIYVDAVINHMTGQESPSTGWAGSPYSHYDHPGTYASWDFHHCGRNGNDDIQNYQDRWEVQNCELVNLADLDTGSTYVRNKIRGYLNDLGSLGVAGFRLDASKHMPSGDIAGILSGVSGTPYVFQEVIDQGGEPITASEYFQNGDVTEFKYSLKLSETFRTGKLAWFNGANQFGEGWGFMPSSLAVVFVDNHDNQRGHGGAGSIITHKDGQLYNLANIFMLAWPYGYPKIMSSYAFSYSDQGPPSDGSGNTLSVYNGDGSVNCFGAQWQCEHRWQAIANMVEFRNRTASDFYVSNWWDNGNNQIAFSRGSKGFVAINKESYGLSRTFQTGLPGGTYCDVTKGALNGAGNGCTGPSVTVAGDGTASITVASWDAVALHAGAKVAGGSVNATFNVYATTFWGQNVFVVGNVTELGNWNTNQGVALSAANYPTWSGGVSLPASTSIQYKYIKKDQYGNVVWESGSNRVFTTPSSGSVTRGDTWR